jgi:thymidylate kinase
MHAFGKRDRTKFVSFSGIDGAGKSTQIEALRSRLEQQNLRVQIVRFWDDIAQLTWLRETTGHTVFKGDKGIGTPAAPINRRDKNVRSLPMTAVRLFIYFIDAISVRIAVRKALRSGAGLVIFDRYIYDELANLTLSNPLIRAYVRLVMILCPMPDISYFLDADPVKARARKPEYPLEFLYRNRQAYLTLSELIGGITVIAPMPIQQVKLAVLAHADQQLYFSAHRGEIIESAACKEDCAGPERLKAPETRPAAS